MHVFIARIVAFMLDWIVLFVIFAAPQFIIATASGQWVLDAESSNVVTWAWVGLTVTIPSFIYFALCDRSRSGMTLGKRVLRIEVRDEDESRLTWAQALVRNVVKLIPWEVTHIMIFFPEPFGEEISTGKIILMIMADVLLIVWLVVPILDWPRFRALHDRAAGTRALPASAG